MSSTLTLTFAGGAGSVTGANFHLTDSVSGMQCLVDCGLFQGASTSLPKNVEPFSYNPADIAFLFVTHSHMDHIGRIPRLVKEGFHGVIRSTPATKDLAYEMLKDSLSVLRSEQKKTGIEPPYDDEDIEGAMRLWKGVEYHEDVPLSGGLVARLYDSGHILGSAMVSFTREGRTLVITGDLGNSPAPIVRDTEALPEAHYLVMESVYGDRNHEDRDGRTELLRSIILETVEKKGTLVIPAFSLERTQDVLFEINNFVESHAIPNVPVFMDSPLAIRVTSIYRKYERYYNADVKSVIKSGDDIFKFPHLSFTETREESERINSIPGPKVIIAGSGMSNGGRVRHHERLYLPDAKNTILLVGYQVPGSLGRQLLEGAKKVRIFDTEVPVRARIASVHGYSAHKDMDGLIAFAAQGVKTLEKVFVTLGEPRSSMFLAQRLRDYADLNTHVPEDGETVTLAL